MKMAAKMSCVNEHTCNTSLTAATAVLICAAASFVMYDIYSGVLHIEARESRGEDPYCVLRVGVMGSKFKEKPESSEDGLSPIGEASGT